MPSKSGGREYQFIINNSLGNTTCNVPTTHIIIVTINEPQTSNTNATIFNTLQDIIPPNTDMLIDLIPNKNHYTTRDKKIKILFHHDYSFCSKYLCLCLVSRPYCSCLQIKPALIFLLLHVEMFTKMIKVD